jgi:hypothetical protein
MIGYESRQHDPRSPTVMQPGSAASMQHLQAFSLWQPRTFQSQYAHARHTNDHQLLRTLRCTFRAEPHDGQITCIYAWPLLRWHRGFRISCFTGPLQKRSRQVADCWRHPVASPAEQRVEARLRNIWPNYAPVRQSHFFIFSSNLTILSKPPPRSELNAGERSRVRHFGLWS